MKPFDLKTLRETTTNRLIELHDAETKSTNNVGINYILAELGRRDQDEQTREMMRLTQEMHQMTADMRWMTKVILWATILALVVALASLGVSLWSR